MFATNLALKFKYQPSHFKVNSSHVGGTGALYSHECF